MDYVRANEQVFLLGSPEFVDAAKTAALTVWSVPFPMDEPEVWKQGDDGRPSDGLKTSNRATRELRNVARREFGLPSVPQAPPGQESESVL